MSIGTTVLLLTTLLGHANAGMCFYNKTASPPRVIVRPAHRVGLLIACQEQCFWKAECLAFSYEQISTNCVLFGAVKERTCAGKAFYPYVKCAAKVNCDNLSDDTASFAKNGGGFSSAFPRCQLKSNFVSTKVCDAPPPGIVCEHSQCFCKNPNQQLVAKSGHVTYSGVRAHCDGGNKYTIFSPNGKTLSLQFSMSDALCTTIARTSFEKCMCDMPLISGGIRDGDRLCGDKKITLWWDESEEDRLTNLKCTPDGWSDGEKIVKPEFVLCE